MNFDEILNQNQSTIFANLIVYFRKNFQKPIFVKFVYFLPDSAKIFKAFEAYDPIFFRVNF